MFETHEFVFQILGAEVSYEMLKFRASGIKQTFSTSLISERIIHECVNRSHFYAY